MLTKLMLNQTDDVALGFYEQFAIGIDVVRLVHGEPEVLGKLTLTNQITLSWGQALLVALSDLGTNRSALGVFCSEAMCKVLAIKWPVVMPYSVAFVSSDKPILDLETRRFAVTAELHNIVTTPTTSRMKSAFLRLTVVPVAQQIVFVEPTSSTMSMDMLAAELRRSGYDAYNIGGAFGSISVMLTGTYGNNARAMEALKRNGRIHVLNVVYELQPDPDVNEVVGA
jgi:hypothetical protein